MLLVWAGGASFHLRVCLPPVPMLSAAAEQIFYALSFHPSFQVTNALVQSILSTAQHRMEVQEMDGAYANTRLHHYMLSQIARQPPAERTMLLGVWCQNHCCHLVTVSCLNVLDCRVLSRLYGLCCFMRNLGHLLRLQLSLKTWLAESLRNLLFCRCLCVLFVCVLVC